MLFFYSCLTRGSCFPPAKLDGHQSPCLCRHCWNASCSPLCPVSCVATRDMNSVQVCAPSTFPIKANLWLLISALVHISQVLTFGVLDFHTLWIWVLCHLWLTNVFPPFRASSSFSHELKIMNAGLLLRTLPIPVFFPKSFNPLSIPVTGVLEEEARLQFFICMELSQHLCWKKNILSSLDFLWILWKEISWSLLWNAPHKASHVGVCVNPWVSLELTGLSERA